MTLLRAASRTLLASYFVSSGVKAVREPQLLVPGAAALSEKVVPMLREYAPQVAGYIPEDATTLVRANGALQLVGGLALASGKGRRLGAVLLATSLVPTTFARHPYWSRETEEERAADKSHFLKNLSLLGGVLIAAGDTEGRPSLAYRAQVGTAMLAKDTRRVGQKVAKETRAISDAAVAEGAALVGVAVTTTRAARRKAAKELKRRNKKLTAQQIKQQRVAARKNAKQQAIQAAQAQKQAKIAERVNAKQEAIQAARAQKEAKIAARVNAKQEALNAARADKEARAAARASAKQDAMNAARAEKEAQANAIREAREAQKQSRKRDQATRRFARNVHRGEN
jgi:uncharacterized membrane protein YphA (DoxX/SURF4 family)